MENNESIDSRWVDERLAALNQTGPWQPDISAGLVRLRERNTAIARVRTRSWVMALAVSTVTAACLIAFPATRVFAKRCVAACVGETSPVLRIFWPSPASRQPTVGRQMAPDFTLNDASGNPVKLSDFRGKVVLLNFWATWCPPCKIEIPWFDEFQRTYGDRGFVVLGVSMDEDGWKSVKPYIDNQKIGYRMMVGNDDIALLYGGLEAVPTTLIIDRSGRIAATHTGLTGKQVLETEVKAILDGQG